MPEPCFIWHRRRSARAHCTRVIYAFVDEFTRKSHMWKYLAFYYIFTMFGKTQIYTSNNAVNLCLSRRLMFLFIFNFCCNWTFHERCHRLELYIIFRKYERRRCYKFQLVMRDEKKWQFEWWLFSMFAFHGEKSNLFEEQRGQFVTVRNMTVFFPVIFISYFMFSYNLFITICCCRDTQFLLLM